MESMSTDFTDMDEWLKVMKEDWTNSFNEFLNKLDLTFTKEWHMILVAKKDLKVAKSSTSGKVDKLQSHHQEAKSLSDSISSCVDISSKITDHLINLPSPNWKEKMLTIVNREIQRL